MNNPTVPHRTLLIAAVLLSTTAHGQWLNYPAPGTPRTRNGKPNLTARTPRAPNGKPDLSGVWRTELAPVGENELFFGNSVTYAAVRGDDPRTFSKYALNILADFKPEDSPMRPSAAEIFRHNTEVRGTVLEASPTAHCLPQGLPRGDTFNYAPFKIVQTPSVIVAMYEMDNTYRQIYTDGRQLPVDPQPSWYGYSIGHWEGETLVVDVAGFNDRTWLDVSGHPHSEALRLQERFHRRDFGHMDLSVTVDDRKMYTKPFTVKVTELLMADGDVLETVCSENEKDQAHFTKH